MIDVVRQRTPMDCGVCCLAMMLGVDYDIALSLLCAARQEHHDTTERPEDGNTINALGHAAAKWGWFVDALPYRDWGKHNINPGESDGIYSVRFRQYGLSKSHFVYVAGGIVHDPYDGTASPWGEYVGKHNVEEEWILVRLSAEQYQATKDAA